MMTHSYKLLDICDFQGGTQPPKSTFSSTPRQNYIRLFQIQDFSHEKFPVYVPISENLSFCDDNNILIGRYGASVGKVFIGKNGAHNVALMKLTANDNIIDKWYLFFYLKSTPFQRFLSQVSSRAAHSGFSKSDLIDCFIDIPSKEKQHQIVKILKTQLTNVEIANKALTIQNQELTNLANAFIRESIEQSSTEEHRLGDILQEVKQGIGANWADYPVLGATRNGLAPAKEPPGKQPQRYKPVVNCTVFYNPMRIMIGSIAFVDHDDQPGITSPDYVVLQGLPGKVDSRWFYYWLRSPYGVQCINALARGAVRERMLFNRLAEGTIHLPSYHAQLRVSKALAALKPVKTAVQNQLHDLDILPERLLTKVFANIAD